MALPANYFQDRMDKQVSTQPKVQSSLTLDARLNVANQQAAYYKKEASRPLWQRWGQHMSESILGKYAPTLEDMDTLDIKKFSKSVTFGGVNTAVNMVKALPGALVKAPLNLSLTLLNTEEQLLGKVLGENRQGAIQKTYTVPGLGKIDSTQSRYEDAKNSGMSRAESAFVAGVETFNDALIGMTAGEIAATLSRPRVVTVKAPGQPKYSVGSDPLPMQATRVKTTAKANQSKVSTGDMFELKQNKNITYQSVPRQVAEKVGGNSSNTFFKRRPLNKSVPGIQNPVEVSIVQVRPSILDKAKGLMSGRISKSKVSTGPYGQEIKLGSWIESGAKNTSLQTVAPKITTVPISSVRTGLMSQLESRLNLSSEKILKYENNYRAGVNMKPVPVYEENGQFILNKDGYHRFMAQKNLGVTDINVEIQPKTRLSARQKQLSENNNIELAKTGSPMSINKSYSAIREGGIDSGFRTTDIDKAQSYALDRNGKVDEFTDEVNNPFVAGGQQEVMSQFIAEGDTQAQAILDEYRQFAVQNRGTSNQDPVVKKMDEYIKTKLSEQGYDAVVYPSENEYQVFDISKSKTVNKQTLEPPFISGEQPTQISDRSLRSPINKPFKGYENEVITEKQISQLNFVKESVGISDETLSIMSRVLNGKNNIYDLSQQEAYELSEAARTFPKASETKQPEDFWGFFALNKSYQQPARDWMDFVEQQTGVPVATDVYYPLEKAFRIQGVEFEKWRTLSEEKFGKYSSVKYYDQRRVISSYVESGGDRSIINNNKNLTPEMKKDFIKIGDWMRGVFADIFPELGIQSTEFFQKYLPNIRKADGIYNLYKSTNDLPPELKAFYRYERQGMLDVKEDDPLALFQIYMKTYTREKWVNNAYNRAQEVKDQLDKWPRMKAATEDYIKEKMGYQDEVSEDLNRLSEKLSEYNPKLFQKDTNKKIVDYLTTMSYGGALAARPMAIMRNYFQMYINVFPELGSKYFVEGQKRFLTPDGKAMVDEAGFQVKMGVPYGSELSAESNIAKNIAGATLNKYQDLNKTLLKAYGKGDELARGIAYHGVSARFEDAYNMLSEGKISYDQFLQNIDYGSFSRTVKKIVDDKLSQNTKESLKEAVEIMTQEVIDRTVFPFRKAAESRLFYGMRGKTAFQFGQWPFEYVNTIVNNWVKRNQWAKLIRWWGASQSIKRATEDLGFDTSKWVGIKAVSGGFPLGPVARMAISLSSAMDNSMQNNNDEFNKNIGDIGNSLKLYLGVAGGVQAQRILKVIKSIDRHEAGIATSPYPDKPYGIYAATGKIKRWVNASDLLKFAFGFADEDEQGFFDNISKIQFENAQYQNKVNDAMNALVDGDFNKFNKIVDDNNLIIGDLSAKLKSYTTPLDLRLFERMPKTLQYKYMPLFYPNQ